jgi:flavodoxin
MIKNIKTAFVVYFSPAGTTHHVAQVIAKTLETSEIEVVPL